MIIGQLSNLASSAPSTGSDESSTYGYVAGASLLCFFIGMIIGAVIYRHFRKRKLISADRNANHGM